VDVLSVPGVVCTTGLLILSLFRLWRFLEHEEVVVAAVREEVVEANVAFELEKRVCRELRSPWPRPRFPKHCDTIMLVVAAAVSLSLVICGVVVGIDCHGRRQKRENLEALVNQLKSKLQWESEARERAEDQIRQYKDEVCLLLLLPLDACGLSPADVRQLRTEGCVVFCRRCVCV
jgi:hypothetical protein